jgi:hypothetical protein
MVSGVPSSEEFSALPTAELARLVEAYRKRGRVRQGGTLPQLAPHP